MTDALMDASSMNPAYQAAEEDYCPDLAAVNFEAIAQLELPAGLRGLSDSLGNSPLAARPEAFIPYFVVMNTLNYQFWSLDPVAGFVRYGHGGAVGAIAMQNSFHAAWLEALGPDAAELSLEETVERGAAFAAMLASKGVSYIFGDIPNPDSRRDILLEVLDPVKLQSACRYLLATLRKEARLGWQDAQVLAKLFPRAYGDRYLKKAQLTLMFIGGQWDALHPNNLCELDVSAAADYQLPKVLRTLGVLVYGPALAALVDSGALIPEDSPEERALRSATVKACKALAAHFKCSIPVLDFWLWMNRNVDRDALFHRTPSTNY